MIAINHPSQPVFEPGQLVLHRRYGYRGVVVERDEFCQADDAWYSKNQTQPDRDQPWYHVLVNESLTCTFGLLSEADGPGVQSYHDDPSYHVDHLHRVGQTEHAFFP